MTISSEVLKAGPFEGNGVTAVFSFTFKTFAETDVEVVHTDSLGVETVLTLDSDYTIVLYADQNVNPGGSVTYYQAGSPMPAGEYLTLRNKPDFVQQTELATTAGYRGQTVEEALDYVTSIATRAWEMVQRAFYVSDGDTLNGNTVLPNSSKRATKVLGFDASGNLEARADLGTIVNAVDIVNAPAGNIQATDVQAAINELDAEKAAKIELLLTGDIADPLVHIPFRRADDALRLSDVQTVARSTTGTYRDPLDGLIKTAAIDTPRFEMMSDGVISILQEESSTNLLTYSEQFDNAAWTKNDVTVTADAIAAPDGNTTADLVVASNISAQHRITQTPASLSAATYTVSVYVKDGGYSSIGNFTILMWNASESAQAEFDVANGVTVGTGSGTIYDSHSIEDMGDGWYRCSMTFTPTATGTFQFMNYIGTGTTTGDGTKGYYLWGAQLENLPFVSSYIPTTSSTVTRAADDCYINGSGNFSRDAWTIICDAEFPVGESLGRLFGTRSGLSFIRTIKSSSYFISVTSATSCSFALDTNDFGTRHRYVFKHDGSGTYTLYVDGVRKSEVNGQPAFDSSSLTTLRIGGYLTSNASSVHESNFRIYDRALTDAEIAVA